MKPNSPNLINFTVNFPWTAPSKQVYHNKWKCKEIVLHYTSVVACSPLPYLQWVSELIARHLRTYNLTIAHKPTESLRKALMHVNETRCILCSECPGAFVGQTGRQFAKRMKEHRIAVRGQDGNSLLALHCLTTRHAFDWTRASVVENRTTMRVHWVLENNTDVC